MSIQSIPPAFILEDYHFQIDQNFICTWLDQEGNKVFQHYLPDGEIGLKVASHNGHLVGEIGDYPNEEPLYHISIRPVDEYPVFELSQVGGGFGVGDLRDVRVALLGHQYDLLVTPIRLKSDGIYLTIYSLLDPDSNQPIGYQKVEIPESSCSHQFQYS